MRFCWKGGRRAGRDAEGPLSLHWMIQIWHAGSCPGIHDIFFMSNAFLLLIVVALKVDRASQADLSVSDLLLAIPSFEGRQQLLRESRDWREGIRTVIVTNATLEDTLHGTPLETYIHYPDEFHVSPQLRHGKKHLFPVHAKRPGDMRTAVAPFLVHSYVANRAGQEYKWLLFGDDDTVFFVPNVLRLLSRLDHTVPMALTDNLW